MSRILFRLRWWKWFLTGPSVIDGHLRGWDEGTRDSIFRRWLDKEPKLPVQDTTMSGNAAVEKLSAMSGFGFSTTVDDDHGVMAHFNRNDGGEHE